MRYRRPAPQLGSVFACLARIFDRAVLLAGVTAAGRYVQERVVKQDLPYLTYTLDFIWLFILFGARMEIEDEDAPEIVKTTLAIS